MQANQDYVYYEMGAMQTIKSPMKHFDVCIVGTKKYIFVIPIKSVGFFMILNTIKTHQLFDGVSIPEGVKKLIDQSNTVAELEESMCALLEDNDLYIYDLENLHSFKFRGFLGRHTLRMARSKMHWAAVGPKKKADSKEMRTFYGQ